MIFCALLAAMGGIDPDRSAFLARSIRLGSLHPSTALHPDRYLRQPPLLPSDCVSDVSNSIRKSLRLSAG